MKDMRWLVVSIPIGLALGWSFDGLRLRQAQETTRRTEITLEAANEQHRVDVATIAAAADVLAQYDDLLRDCTADLDRQTRLVTRLRSELAGIVDLTQRAPLP